MSHIAIDARQLRTSTGRYIERLVHYLQEVDTDNTYTILLKPADMAGWHATNPNFTKVACPYKEFAFGEQIGFAIQLYKLKADLVHFGITQQPLLYFKPSITTIHDLTTARFTNPDKQALVFKVKQQIYEVVILWAARKSKSVITPSQYVADDLARYTGIRPSKITVTYESADKVLTSPVVLPYLQNKKFIMYIGRPTPHKNLERLIEAFKLLKQTDPSLHLVLAGKLDNNYRRLQTDLKDDKTIIFTDFISDEELAWLYENTAAYVFPSLSEGFGLPGLEAMHYGAPVVSSNATCLPEIYADGAHYFDPTDVTDMARAINDILTEKTLRDTIVHAANLQVLRYSWRRMAQQTVSVYLNVLKR